MRRGDAQGVNCAVIGGNLLGGKIGGLLPSITPIFPSLLQSDYHFIDIFISYLAEEASDRLEFLPSSLFSLVALICAVIGFSLVSCDRLLHHHQVCSVLQCFTLLQMVVTDPAWKYGKVVPPPDGKKKAYKYVQCNFCAKVCKGGIGRLKSHLAWSHKGVSECHKVPDEVRVEMKTLEDNYKAEKHNSQRNFQEDVSSGAYFGTGAGGSGSSSGGSSDAGSRGVRGPMDRYVTDVQDDEQGPTPQEILTPAKAKELRNQVCLDIGRFFFENGIPFNPATSPSYYSMMRSIGNYGRGFKPPSMHELRTWVLQAEVKTTTMIVDDIRATWKTTGVSLLSDGWSDMRNRSLINFLVNNQHGTVFYKTVDASNCIKNAEKLFELLDGVVEEIGADLVIQVVTDNASAYKAAGTLLMDKRKTLYWTPCAAHCIDLMLEKIGDEPEQKTCLLKAKKVSNFIYNHQWVLALARKFLGKDLLRPAATRFATAFLTIQSIGDLKEPLQQMFVSSEWSSSAWGKKEDGRAIKKIIMDERVFWPSVVNSIKTTKPLVEVLRLVDGEQVPAMAFIYGAMDECKEKIAKNFDNNLGSYKKIWEIIDSKWEKQLHRHLHAAAYYLNPRYRWSPDVSEHGEIKRGLFHVMDTLVKNNEEYMKIEDQLITYKDKKGLFSYRGSLASYKTRPPVKWWEQYGDDTPELKAFAVKVLGLTCSASACERNWSTYNQVHTKRRNRLNTQRMNDLVYIMYNKKLKQKFNKKSNLKENEDLLDVEYVMSDDEWTVGGDAEVLVPNGSGGVADGGVAEFDGAVEVVDGGDEDPVVVGTVREEAGTVREAGTAPAVVAVASSSSRKRKKHAHALNLLDEDDEEAQYDSDALFAELD
ncbi:hypothetical protein LXL04_023934 [Taraxacum kok-saghyz]